MLLNSDSIAGLNTAFDEARLLGVELDANRRLVGLTISRVCMDADGTIPEDRRVQVLLSPVGRLAASLRNSRWDDDKAEAIPFLQEKLLETVTSFGGLPIYGWNFFDNGDEGFSRWKDRLSLNYESKPDGTSHTLDLFQDGNQRTLQIRIWFDDIKFNIPGYKEVPMEEFIQSGKRAWDAIMLKNDKRVQDAFCIYPMPPDTKTKKE